ncbi:MAG: hypothetical protein GXY85_07210 [Candidatus Brocadiaceae bacterium]|nr:hypothetical protein [Candidatus Brocadiaceae bacterium]
MKRAVCVILAIGLAAAAAAAQQGTAAPVVGEVKIPVRHYKSLSPNVVYRAALDGVNADVRFRDAYAGRADVPAGLGTVRARGGDHPVAVAFRTQAGLLCLVPSTGLEALRNLFRLPPQQPLTPQVLRGPLAVNAGQQITVEGALVGKGTAQKLVLVDSVFTYDAQVPEVQREVELLWQGATAPFVIDRPGRVAVSVPCAAVPGQTVEAAVTVEALSPDALLDRLAAVTAVREGRPGTRKAYGQYDANTVYRHASADNPVNVDFTDTVSGVFRTGLPRELLTVRALRNDMLVDLPTGLAFEVASQVVCLVPSDMPTPLARASTAVPGERVRIRGTTAGRRGGYSIVSVDYVGFPEQDAEARDAWLVRLEWPGTRPREFWDFGLYRLSDLPCPGAPARTQALQVFLSEFRRLEVAVPVPAGAGAGG